MTIQDKEGMTMPRRDHTGSVGMGPMTGRAAGYCAGFENPRYAHQGTRWNFGMRSGRGRGACGRGAGGGGRGWRNMFFATGQPGWGRSGRVQDSPGFPPLYQKPDPQQEKRALKNQAEVIQSQLESITRRLNEIEKGASEV